MANCRAGCCDRRLIEWTTCRSCPSARPVPAVAAGSISVAVTWRRRLAPPAATLPSTSRHGSKHDRQQQQSSRQHGLLGRHDRRIPFFDDDLQDRATERCQGCLHKRRQTNEQPQYYHIPYWIDFLLYNTYTSGNNTRVQCSPGQPPVGGTDPRVASRGGSSRRSIRVPSASSIRTQTQQAAWSPADPLSDDANLELEASAATPGPR